MNPYEGAAMTVRTVTGYITSYKREKSFGFARTFDITGEAIDVFFHISRARTVVWKDGEYQFGSQLDKDANPRGLGRNPMYIVMEVSRTENGWRATMWAERPGPNWVHAAISSGGLRQFHGGTFSKDVVTGEGILTPQDHCEGKIEQIIATPYELLVVHSGSVDPLRVIVEKTRYSTIADGVAEIRGPFIPLGYERVLNLRMPGY
jgi:hypothetical protein